MVDPWWMYGMTMMDVWYVSGGCMVRQWWIMNGMPMVDNEWHVNGG